jgi:hypothetical protein
MDARTPTAPGAGAPQHRLAVLIDADNAQASAIDGILEEVAGFGTASVRRIYGNWTGPELAGWKKTLLEHSIQPVQQFAYTSGKNATDSALIIDAMDLMYTRRFDGFCLVSSDSDFTRLAQRLREEGLTVYGFGERKTPAAFVKACDRFVYTEVLRADVASPAKPAAASTEKLPLALIEQAIGEADDDSGWANLAAVGSYLTKLRPDFDARLFGFRKLSDLLRSRPTAFEVQERGEPGSPAKSLYVRIAVARSAPPGKPKGG